MDAKPVLRVIAQQLSDSHDVRNTQIRLFQVARDSSLALSPGQRGALNFYSSLPNVDESTLVQLLSTLPSVAPAIPSPTPSFADQDVLEPVVKQTPQGQYQWSFAGNLNVDTTMYATPTEAQHQADQFVQELHNQNEKNWIRMGIVHWAQQNRSLTTCYAELFRINQLYYVLVATPLSTPLTNELQEQKTVMFTSKVINMEPLLSPTWMARGFVPRDTYGLFYILFRANPQPSESLSQVAQQLQRILC
jgi:hypothetical protein